MDLLEAGSHRQVFALATCARWLSWQLVDNSAEFIDMQKRVNGYNRAFFIHSFIKISLGEKFQKSASENDLDPWLILKGLLHVQLQFVHELFHL